MKWIVVVLVVSMALMAMPLYAAQAFLMPTHNRFSETTSSIGHADENADLKKVLCSQINRAFRQNQTRWSKKLAPYDLETFRQTERHLSSGPVNQPFLSTDERQALVRDLIGAVPQVIAGCRDNPEQLYVDYLPESVRQAL